MEPTFGDDEFVRIVSVYQPKLNGFARRITGDRQDAEEVVQDALFRAYRSLRAMSSNQRSTLPLKPWLYIITRNAALNHLRKKRLYPVPLDGSKDFIERLANLVEPETPEATTIDRLTLQEVEELLRRLPKHLQEAARLRFVHGFTPSQIAITFAKPLGTVKSHLHRAVTAMRRMLMSAA